MTDFEIEFRNKLITHLNMQEIDVKDIDADSTLFGEGSGLELDSIDAIEIEVFLKSEYGLDVHPSERTEGIFGTVGSLASFVQKNRNRDV
jgi:acyl carrier protein